MKKLLLFVAATAMLTACSGDDSSGTNSKAPVTVTINGKKKSFSNVDVEKDGNRVYVTAMNGNSSEILTFEHDMGYTGEENIYYVQYIKDNHIYDESFDGDGLTDNVEISNDFRLKGTFSGTMMRYDENWENVEETITLTNGSFDIVYE